MRLPRHPARRGTPRNDGSVGFSTLPELRATQRPFNSAQGDEHGAKRQDVIYHREAQEHALPACL